MNTQGEARVQRCGCTSCPGDRGLRTCSGDPQSHHFLREEGRSQGTSFSHLVCHMETRARSSQHPWLALVPAVFPLCLADSTGVVITPLWVTVLTDPGLQAGTLGPEPPPLPSLSTSLPGTGAKRAEGDHHVSEGRGPVPAPSVSNHCLDTPLC